MTRSAQKVTEVAGDLLCILSREFLGTRRGRGACTGSSPYLILLLCALSPPLPSNRLVFSLHVKGPDHATFYPGPVLRITLFRARFLTPMLLNGSPGQWGQSRDVQSPDGGESRMRRCASTEVEVLDSSYLPTTLVVSYAALASA